MLENATDVNSGEIPNLNPDEVCERPWPRNATVHNSQNY
jgi:hypothetical protein